MPLSEILDKALPSMVEEGVDSLFYMLPYAENRHLDPLKQAAEKHALKLRYTHPGRDIVHLGFAGWFNLDLIAAAKPQAAVMCDKNRDQAKMWRETFRTLATRETPEAFLASWNDKLTAEGDRLCLHTEEGKVIGKNVTDHTGFLPQHALPIAKELPWLQNGYAHNAGWLKHQTPYNYIRKLVLEGRMATVTTDILNTPRIGAMMDILGNLGYAPGVVYTANIGEFLRPIERSVMAMARRSPEKCRKALKTLPLDQVTSPYGTGFFRENFSEPTGPRYDASLKRMSGDTSLLMETLTDPNLPCRLLTESRGSPAFHF